MKRDLGEALRIAIAHSLDAVRRAHQGETLVGYGLCTDDDLRTVSHLACTEEALARSAHSAQQRHIPVEWPYADGAEGFQEALRILQADAEQATSDTFAHHVEAGFEVMVESLVASQHRFGPGVLLLVTSTDPGPRLEELGQAAARRLNSPELFDAWKRAMGY